MQGPAVEILGYRLDAELGTGGMATVWLARNPAIGKTVAIKVLDPLLARRPKVLERFRAEAEIQYRLRHTNIVCVENLVMDPPAFVMELVDGPSLDRVLREEGPLAPEMAAPIMLGMLDGLEYAHGQGIVHRDIKPGNVMLTRSGIPKMMDFGIAKLDWDASTTKTGAAMGTPAYMSPEQIRSPKDVDRRSDIYSVGATFYEMLTGRPPFVGESDFAVRLAHVQDRPSHPCELAPGMPACLADVLLVALAKDPADRYQSAVEMRDALRAALGARDSLPCKQATDDPPWNGRPDEIPAVEPSPSSAPSDVATSTETTRSPRTRAGFILGALALVATLAWAAWLWRESKPSTQGPEPVEPGTAQASATTAGRGAEPDPPAVTTKAPTPALVVLQTTPPGATLSAATGENLGATPITLRSPPMPTRTTLRVHLDGYRSSEVAVSFPEAGEERSVSVELQRPPVVRLRSTPAGAAVSLGEDGTKIGVTPLDWTVPEAVLARMEAKVPMAVVFELAGYRRVEMALAGGLVDASLERVSALRPAPTARAPKPRTAIVPPAHTAKPHRHRPPAGPKPASKPKPGSWSYE